jgi:hypothetical protein
LYLLIQLDKNGLLGENLSFSLSFSLPLSRNTQHNTTMSLMDQQTFNIKRINRGGESIHQTKNVKFKVWKLFCFVCVCGVWNKQLWREREEVTQNVMINYSELQRGCPSKVRRIAVFEWGQHFCNSHSCRVLRLILKKYFIVIMAYYKKRESNYVYKIKERKCWCRWLQEHIETCWDDQHLRCTHPHEKML